MSFAAAIAGLLCYTLTCSSFNHLFGEWNFLKIFFYSVISIILSLIILLCSSMNAAAPENEHVLEQVKKYLQVEFETVNSSVALAIGRHHSMTDRVMDDLAAH